MKIKAITQEQVIACNFKPEPHTVSLKDDGCWWALMDGDEILSVVCVSNKNGGKCYSQVYTPPNHRGNGYSTKLIRTLSEKIYAKEYQIAHCLKASVNIFYNAGFALKTIRYFKHGNQYFMEKLNGKTKDRY